MNNQSVDKEYEIKITKPSKYKKLNTWVKSSGELSKEEIASIMYCDKLDTIQEDIEQNFEKQKELINSLYSLELNKVDVISKMKEKINENNQISLKSSAAKKY